MAAGAVTKYSLLVGTKVTGTNQVVKLGNSMQGVQGKAKNLAISMKGLATSFIAVTATFAAFRTFTRSFDVFAERTADLRVLATGLSRVTEEAPQAAKALKSVADQLGLATLFDERDFVKGFNLLTSFKNIGVESYSRVAETAADLAQINQVDLKSSFMQLAKALSDPQRGLTALSRSGVIFTDTQRQMILALHRSGREMQAQAEILRIIEGSYKGTARAAALGLAGSFDTLGQRVRDLQEQLGALLTPLAQPVVDGLASFIESMSAGLEELNQNVPKAVEAMWPLFEVTKLYAAVWAGLQTGKVIAAVIAGAKILKSIDLARLAMTKARALLEIAIAAKNPLAALGVGTAAYVLLDQVIKGATESVKELYKELEDDTAFKTVQKNVEETGDSFKKAFDKALEGIKEKLDDYMKSLKDVGGQIGDAIVSAFKGMEDALVDFVSTGKLSFKSLVNSILADLARIAIRQAFIRPLMGALQSGLGNLGGGIGGGGGGSGVQGNFLAPQGWNQISSQSNNFPVLNQFASGGYVTGPTSALIGEGGQSEYVIPENRMSSALSRYASGARGDAVLDGGSGELATSGGGYGGGTTTLDIRYAAEVINNVEYVTASQFREGMNEAAAQGARRGEQQTLRRLQMSPGTRKKVGI